MTFKQVFRLTVGIILFSIGIVCTVQANLGVAPWDTLHQGLSKHSGLTFGQVSIFVGLSIVAINILLKELVGLGTVVNIVLIGLIVDALFTTGIIPEMTTFLGGLVMLVIGMFILALGSYYYIGAGLGTGPRDGLMVALVKKTGKPVGLIRGAIEGAVLILGYLLGGSIGIGTLILALGIGPIVQWVFGLLSFDVAAVEHQVIFPRQKAV